MSEPISKADLAFPRAFTRHSHRLYAEGHDAVDNVVVVLLEGLDGLLPAHASLGHDELDVLGLKAGVVDLLAIVLLLLLLLGTLDGLALVTLGGVVVAGVVVGGLAGELLGSLGLGLGVEVLNLGLTEDAVLQVSYEFLPSHWVHESLNIHPGVAVGALVDVGLGDDEEDVLGAAESDAGDALDVLQAELANGLAGLLLVPVVNGDGSASGNVGLAGLRLRVRVASLDLDVLHGLIGDLFDSGVCHCECVGKEYVGFWICAVIGDASLVLLLRAHTTGIR